MTQHSETINPSPTAKLRGTAALADLGVSIWLDDLSRELLSSGRLAELVASHNVVGVTTNPAIFASAIGSGAGYDADIAAAAAAGMSPGEIVFSLASADVQAACDVLADIYRNTVGRDGYVSIEVDPALAHDTAGTVAQATELWQRIDRPNLMIKIPATDAGLAAITETIAQGINVNVTLIFNLTRYREVLNAYQTGLELARAAGKDLSRIHSVASFFISRLDTAADPLLEAAGADAQLCGKTGVAGARLAHQILRETAQSERAQLLAASGAQPQRLLWASTGVKNPALPATYYVSELATANTVNTMPAATLEAVITASESYQDLVTDSYGEAARVLDEVAHTGVDYVAITAELERVGAEKFVDAWTELVSTVAERAAESK